MTTTADTPLTPKQAAFVTEYLVDLNASKAAARAGYSARTADKQGSQLLANKRVAAAIDAAKLERSKRVGVDADYVLNRLHVEAEAKLSDIFDIETGDLKPVHDWPDIWQQGLVGGVEIDALFEGSGEDKIQIGHTKKVRLSDRVRRLELIGKHIKVNAFQDTVKVNGLDGLGDRLERAFKRLEGVK